MDHTFTLSDADGTPHTYTVQPHRGHQGAPLALQLLALVVEPLAVGAGPVIMDGLGRTKGKPGGAIAQLLDDDQVLQSLDLEALARGVRTAMLGLRLQLMLDVLRYTNRDGKPLVTDALQPTGTFDVAFARNYQELGLALWEVARFNGFFPALSTIAGAARTAAAALPATRGSGG